MQKQWEFQSEWENGEWKGKKRKPIKEKQFLLEWEQLWGEALEWNIEYGELRESCQWLKCIGWEL